MIYLDSSALVKRYVRERGGAALEKRLAGGFRLFTSAITYAEVHAALARKYSGTGKEQDQLRRVRKNFERDWLEIEEVEVTPETLSPVPAIVEAAPLRGMDAIHLAAAVWLDRKLGEKAEFVVSDGKLLKAARQFGFDVWDPAGKQAGN